MLSFISLSMVVFPNYKFSFRFHTWNIIKSNLVGTTACVAPLAACTRSRFFFSVSLIDTKLYAHPTMSIEQCPDVTQRAYCVRIRAHLAWGAHWPCPRAPKKLGSSHACLHINHVQAGPFGSAGGQVWKRFSLMVPPKDPKLFAHRTMTMACMW